VERASLLCKAAGAKRAVPLPVSAPFHCALMRPAQDRLETDLRAIGFRDPDPPLVNNVDARPVRTAAECREGLVRQVSAPVRWQESVERLLGEGASTFVEVGPGSVLWGLVKKISRQARVSNVEDPKSLDATLSSLALAGAP
jgi:[acyl-carrier-protein] S-malonyltransferase